MKTRVVYTIIFLITLIYSPPLKATPNLWTNYQTIMWIGDTPFKNKEKIPLFFERMREMGVTAISIQSWGDPAIAITNNFNYYVENIINRGLCLKWNSKVTNWEKFIREWMSTRSESDFIRDYCLDDPQWKNWAAQEMEKVVKRNINKNPLAYNIRDELSVTVSANPFDYDFNPITIQAFISWLKSIYGTLDNLNKEWETDFKSWNDVKPFSTDLIKNRMASGQPKPQGKPDWQALQRVKFDPVKAQNERTRWNFSPWCDFRTYMDISLSKALADIRAAAKAIDPATPVGIEGTQMPHAFGGYDLWRLSQVLDWVEPYDIGNSREIFGSFMNGKLFLTTVFEKETQPALRRLWHLLLSGDRGCIIWWSEDCIDWTNPDYPLTQKAKALSPALKEITSPLARIFLNAHPIRDPIAILYSQPSIQVDWLIESTVDGATWVRRFSSYEASHNRMAKVRNSWIKLFQDLGFTPFFISTDQIVKGLLDKNISILVLPTAIALSNNEIKAIDDFINDSTRPKLVFSDGTPGLFDEHGKLRATAPLGKYFPLSYSSDISYCINSTSKKLTSLKGDISSYGVARLKNPPSLEWLKWVKECLNLSSPKPISQDIICPYETRTRIFKYKLGDARLYAFERGIDYHMSEELKQAGGNESLQIPVRLTASLVEGGHIYDLRQRKYLGYSDKIEFVLDPWKPSLFAVLNQRLNSENDIIKHLLNLQD
ncbi:MAG: beta-galactosidase [Verrucomicrobiia bacterium]